MSYREGPAVTDWEGCAFVAIGLVFIAGCILIGWLGGS